MNRPLQSMQIFLDALNNKISAYSEEVASLKIQLAQASPNLQMHNMIMMRLQSAYITLALFNSLRELVLYITKSKRHDEDIRLYNLSIETFIAAHTKLVLDQLGNTDPALITAWQDNFKLITEIQNNVQDNLTSTPADKETQLGQHPEFYRQDKEAKKLLSSVNKFIIDPLGDENLSELYKTYQKILDLRRNVLVYIEKDETFKNMLKKNIELLKSFQKGVKFTKSQAELLKLLEIAIKLTNENDIVQLLNNAYFENRDSFNRSEKIIIESLINSYVEKSDLSNKSEKNMHELLKTSYLFSDLIRSILNPNNIMQEWFISLMLTELKLPKPMRDTTPKTNRDEDLLAQIDSDNIKLKEYMENYFAKQAESAVPKLNLPEIEELTPSIAAKELANNIFKLCAQIDKLDNATANRESTNVLTQQINELLPKNTPELMMGVAKELTSLLEIKTSDLFNRSTTTPSSAYRILEYILFQYEPIAISERTQLPIALAYALPRDMTEAKQAKQATQLAQKLDKLMTEIAEFYKQYQTSGQVHLAKLDAFNQQLRELDNTLMISPELKPIVAAELAILININRSQETTDFETKLSMPRTLLDHLQYDAYKKIFEEQLLAFAELHNKHVKSGVFSWNEITELGNAYYKMKKAYENIPKVLLPIDNYSLVLNAAYINPLVPGVHADIMKKMESNLEISEMKVRNLKLHYQQKNNTLDTYLTQFEAKKESYNDIVTKRHPQIEQVQTSLAYFSELKQLLEQMPEKNSQLKMQELIKSVTQMESKLKVIFSISTKQTLDLESYVKDWKKFLIDIRDQKNRLNDIDLFIYMQLHLKIKQLSSSSASFIELHTLVNETNQNHPETSYKATLTTIHDYQTALFEVKKNMTRLKLDRDAQFRGLNKIDAAQLVQLREEIRTEYEIRLGDVRDHLAHIKNEWQTIQAKSKFNDGDKNEINTLYKDMLKQLEDTEALFQTYNLSDNVPKISVDKKHLPPSLTSSS